jgi:anti-sigma regulatory factor (Ser/Thr protein kinase)
VEYGVLEELATETLLKVRIPPEPHLSRVVRERLVEFAMARGVGDEDLTEFLTALGEALANAIEHARSLEPIEIECHIDGGQIVATVTDGGVGFLRTPGAPTGPPDLTSERGRGMLIMRRCSHIFDVSSTPGRGTAVRVGRYLRSGTAGSTPQRASA